jgi:hypothetical protein
MRQLAAFPQLSQMRATVEHLFEQGGATDADASRITVDRTSRQAAGAGR